MSDERLRALERRYRESGSKEDYLAWLSERVRSGELRAPEYQHTSGTYPSLDSNSFNSDEHKEKFPRQPRLDDKLRCLTLEESLEALIVNDVLGQEGKAMIWMKGIDTMSSYRFRGENEEARVYTCKLDPNLRAMAEYDSILGRYHREGAIDTEQAGPFEVHAEMRGYGQAGVRWFSTPLEKWSESPILRSLACAAVLDAAQEVCADYFGTLPELRVTTSGYLMPTTHQLRLRVRFDNPAPPHNDKHSPALWIENPTDHLHYLLLP